MNKPNHTRELLNPVDVIENMGFDASHIKFNPNLSRVKDAQYDIIRQSTHDGTLAFTINMFGELLEPLINKCSHHTEQEIKGVTDVKYEVGYIRHSVVYGEVELRSGKYPGIKERVRVPVKCILTY